MIKLKLYKLMILSACLVALNACKDTFNDDHYKIKNANTNLIDQIKATSTLSEFAKYLTQTGYDKILAETQLFTVYAPTNDALAKIDPKVVNDADQLKKLVANHISYKAYFTFTPDTSLDVEMLSGKIFRITKNSTKIDDADIINPDKACTNGVLQIVNTILPIKQNIWDYFLSSTAAPLQTGFLSSYYVRTFDQAHSTKIGVYETTGQDKYDSVWVTKNRFLSEVADLQDEHKKYTFFMLSDNGFYNLFTTFRNYCTMSTDVLTDVATEWAISNDMVFNGIYTNLPDSLVSIQGTTVPVDHNAILGSFMASNGIVYILDNCPMTVKQKIIPVIVQGESPNRIYSRIDLFDAATANAAVPNINASGYQYLNVAGHNTPNFYIDYPVDKVYAIKYDVYWVAYGTSTPLPKQSLSIVNDTTYAAVTQTATFTLVKVGSYTFKNFGGITLRVLSDGSSNPIDLDYIKLVPVLQ